MLIQGANRANCCLKKQLNYQDRKNNLVDICGRVNDCCTSTCVSPTAISYVTDEKLNIGKLIPSVSNSNAFFFETSGAMSLSVRQACAVESLARLNPKLRIYLFFGSSNTTEKTVNIKTPAMHHLLERYSNIRPRIIHYDGFFADTPLEKWYQCSNWNYGPFAISHLSDALRFLTLFKYGGYYFDLDVIHLKPVAPLYQNFVAVESILDDVLLGSAAMHAQHRHPFILTAVEEFRTTYR